MPRKRLYQIGLGQESLTKLLRSRVVGIQSFWRQKNKIKAKINMSTGIMLSNQFILTAGHNIYVDQFKKIADDIRIIFMQDDNNLITDRNLSLLIKPLLHYDVELLFKDNDARKGLLLDLALIKLKRIQKIANNLNLDCFDQKRFGKQVAIVSGFPDLKFSQNKVLRDQNQAELVTELRIDTGQITKLSSNYMYYSQIDTFTGQSGGPIFINFQKKLYLVGIHAEYNQMSRSGKGVMLTDKILKIIVNWSINLKAGLKIQEFSKDQIDYSTKDLPQTQIQNPIISSIIKEQFQKSKSTNYSSENISPSPRISIQLPENISPRISIQLPEDSAELRVSNNNHVQQSTPSFRKDNFDYQLYNQVLFNQFQSYIHEVGSDTKY